MKKKLARCLYELAQLADGEKPENSVLPNILNLTWQDIRRGGALTRPVSTGT